MSSNNNGNNKRMRVGTERNFEGWYEFASEGAWLSPTEAAPRMAPQTPPTPQTPNQAVWGSWPTGNTASPGGQYRM